MPRELPGFYFDEARNRYFPIKGPIPGSSNKRKSSTKDEAENSNAHQNEGSNMPNSRSRIKLLQFREISGNQISSSKGKLNFQAEYEKKLVSHPLICKYHDTNRIAETAVELVNVRINRGEGVVSTDLLFTGDGNGYLSYLEVGKLEENDFGLECKQDEVWPLNSTQLPEQIEVPRCLFRSFGGSKYFGSSISSIKVCPRSTQNNVLFTILGSGRSRGALYIWRQREPLNGFPLKFLEVTSFRNTVWTADSNYNGSHAVVGTNKGAYLVDIENGAYSQVFRCKSDVMSAQFHHKANVILCGLRGGQIVRVDGREKPKELAARYRLHSSTLLFNKDERERILYGSSEISMPSSISCLTPLSLYDQYFLASSMDGSIKLYDLRLFQKGAVQSYEGNLNSHSRLQLGVDPSEKFVLSGGEDCKLRLWSIKSGKKLFEAQVMNSVPTAVCWPRPEVLWDQYENYREIWEHQVGACTCCGHWEEYREQGQKNRGGVWIGSREGLFYMNWPCKDIW